MDFIAAKSKGIHRPSFHSPNFLRVGRARSVAPLNDVLSFSYKQHQRRENTKSSQTGIYSRSHGVIQESGSVGKELLHRPDPTDRDGRRGGKLSNLLLGCISVSEQPAGYRGQKGSSLCNNCISGKSNNYRTLAD